jgi:glutaredoxin
MKSYLIYAKEECPYCEKLLSYMKQENKRFIYVLVYNLEEKLQEVMNKYNWNTVPIVIEMEENNGETKLIGGCDDAIKYFKQQGVGGDPLPYSGND